MKSRAAGRLHRGYTLVELLAVLAILSILAMGAFPMAELARKRQQEADLRQALWEIRDALDAYKRAVDSGLIARQPGSAGYPPSLRELVAGVPNQQGQMIYFLRRLPRDPFADPKLAAEATWGLRSYASPPDAPQPGDDVFDVHSLSLRLGVNGTPLKDW